MEYKADLIPMLVISFGHDQNWTTEEWGEEEKKKIRQNDPGFYISLPLHSFGSMHR